MNKCETDGNETLSNMVKEIFSDHIVLLKDELTAHDKPFNIQSDSDSNLCYVHESNIAIWVNSNCLLSTLILHIQVHSDSYYYTSGRLKSIYSIVKY